MLPCNEIMCNLRGKEIYMYIPDTMNCRDNPFIADDDGFTSVPRTSLEAQLIRILLYVSYRTSCDSRVKNDEPVAPERML